MRLYSRDRLRVFNSSVLIIDSCQADTKPDPSRCSSALSLLTTVSRITHLQKLGSSLKGEGQCYENYNLYTGKYGEAVSADIEKT